MNHQNEAAEDRRAVQNVTIRTRQMAVAFLFHGGKVLLMKKQASNWQRQTMPFYSGIGGHMETDELNDPIDACYREIEEETGLKREDVSELKLKYILLRLKGDEMRQQYVYVGETKRANVVESDEGELGWHRPEEVGGLRSSAIHHAVFAHYIENPDREHIFSGTMSIDADGGPLVHWNALIDPEVF
ncbi:NUDIX domain-containing protein [Paenibacillus mendelii]|uniref:NUDIX domain-containing protein n=1 Tax=Paenibacillus mendelii TaxID=206163 RepID=A0ABV6JAX0_9BACL|nr:NUDIX domain-containing protein [Paenibacillus mendelii]MCQ6562926.1 NUDIX domain-containing protein [Paenibacillus mendelii]